jgi:hypothetical protein
MFPLYGLPFLSRSVVTKPLLISCHQPGKETLMVLILNRGVCESVRISKYWFAASIRKLPDCNGAGTSVGSMWSVLKCHYAAVIISQPVFQEVPIISIKSSHITTLMMGTEIVPETSVSTCNQLTRLCAREYFIEFSRRESFRLYIPIIYERLWSSP